MTLEDERTDKACRIYDATSSIASFAYDTVPTCIFFNSMSALNQYDVMKMLDVPYHFESEYPSYHSADIPPFPALLE